MTLKFQVAKIIDNDDWIDPDNSDPPKPLLSISNYTDPGNSYSNLVFDSLQTLVDQFYSNQIVDAATAFSITLESGVDSAVWDKTGTLLYTDPWEDDRQTAISSLNIVYQSIVSPRVSYSPVIESLSNTTRIAFPVATWNLTTNSDNGTGGDYEYLSQLTDDGWANSPFVVGYAYDDGDYSNGPLGSAGPEDDPTNPNDDPTDDDDGDGSGSDPFDPNEPLPDNPEDAGDGEWNELDSEPPNYKLLLRSRDVTSVINGFGWLMENNLPYYVDNGQLSYLKKALDLNNHRITNLGEAVAVSDLIRKIQAEGEA